MTAPASTKPSKMGDVRLQPMTYIPSQTSQKMGDNHERRTDTQPRPSPELRAERAWKPTHKYAAEPVPLDVAAARAAAAAGKPTS